MALGVIGDRQIVTGVANGALVRVGTVCTVLRTVDTLICGASELGGQAVDQTNLVDFGVA